MPRYLSAMAGDTSNEMAQDRTDWAEDRTILAMERTFAGWMRTGMACIALALGMKAVFAAYEPTWVPKVAATVFVALGISIFWSARNKACTTARRMEDHTTEPQPTRNMTILATGLTIGAIVTGGVLITF